MKMKRLAFFIIILLLVALLAPLILTIGSAWAEEKPTNTPLPTKHEDIETADTVDNKTPIIPDMDNEESLNPNEIMDGPETLEEEESSENLASPEESSFAEMMPFNETVIPVGGMQLLRDTIIDLNRAPAATPNPVIRITSDIFWGHSGASGFINITHPNLTIEAGAGNFTIFTTGNGAFMPSGGGRLTLRGGPLGGRLTIQGNAIEGSGVFIRSGSTGTIQNNVVITGFPVSGVRVENNATFNLTGNARLHHNRNRTGQGGGVQVLSGGTFNMSGGVIDFNTGVFGGGVHVAQGGIFNMTGGRISDNFSVHQRAHGTNQILALGSGGGLFVPASNLPNITITSAAIFRNNVAESGIRVDNDLAEQYHQTIRPGTVSVTEMGLFIKDDGTYSSVAPHAFTNYDINTSEDIPRLWRLVFETRDNPGNIIAKNGDTGEEILSGTYVPEGTEVIFIPNPASLLNKWIVESRLTEIDEEGIPMPYRFLYESTDIPLSVIIMEHTRVLGHFLQGFTLTKDPNDGVVAPFIQRVRPGPHQLFYIPTHTIEGYQFTGWNTQANGTGISYDADAIINITEDTTLYAQWILPTTSVTISKEVTGALGNKNMPFDFEIYFTAAMEKPLSSDSPLYYTIVNKDKKVIADGSWILDESGYVSFQLKHGETIRIEEVPLGGYIQVFELRDNNYITSFVDSEDPDIPIIENDTGVLPITPDRTFYFTNERVYVPPTDVDSGNTKPMRLLALITSVAATIMFTIRAYFKPKNTLLGVAVKIP